MPARSALQTRAPSLGASITPSLGGTVTPSLGGIVTPSLGGIVAPSLGAVAFAFVPPIGLVFVPPIGLAVCEFVGADSCPCALGKLFDRGLSAGWNLASSPQGEALPGTDSVPGGSTIAVGTANLYELHCALPPNHPSPLTHTRARAEGRLRSGRCGACARPTVYPLRHTH